MTKYLDGEHLYGDDFSIQQIEEWFRDEEEGYAQIAQSDRNKDGTYAYHGLNWVAALNRLPRRRFPRALGFGSAEGEEFIPIARRIDQLVIVEPSQSLRGAHVGHLRPTYVAPAPSGLLPFESGHFDLILCLGVLHHIPNVSVVMSELARVLNDDGVLVLREPVVSLGDWTRTRPGLTARERGIPARILDRLLDDNQLRVVQRRWCAFPTTRRLGRISPLLGYGGRVGASLDLLLSGAFAWNYSYHAENPFKKMRPNSVFYITERRPSHG